MKPRDLRERHCVEGGEINACVPRVRMVGFGHQRAVDASMTDPKRRRFVVVCEGGPDPGLEHIYAFPTVVAGVEKIVGPCVQLAA